MKNKKDNFNRQSIRLKGYDYSTEGLYFITICTHKRKHLFGKIINNEMILNPIGIIANNQWQLLAKRFIHIEMGPFIVMPNHIHGIIMVRATLAVAHDPIDSKATLAVAHDPIDSHDSRATTRVAPTNYTLGNIVGAYKSLVVNRCVKYANGNGSYGGLGKIWHRNYYEHIIRNEKSFHNISNYIQNNPTKWGDDQFK